MKAAFLNGRRKSSRWQNAIASTLQACAPLDFASHRLQATQLPRIANDAAVPRPRLPNGGFAGR